MRSDSEIKRDVEDELRFDPDVDSSDIGVAVKNGVVALTGFVKRYSEKFEAESAAKRVAGVVGLANDIDVRLPTGLDKPDPEIARGGCSHQDKAAGLGRAHPSCRQERVGDARGPGRVELPARGG